MRKTFFIQLFLIGIISWSPPPLFSSQNSKYPADITFLAIDLKYNQEKGIQICEIQQGILSQFLGFDFLHGIPRLVASTFCSHISEWEKPVLYYRWDCGDPGFLEKFQEEGYIRANKKKLFDVSRVVGLEGLKNITNYQGIYFGRIQHFAKTYDEFIRLYPGILPADFPFYQFYKDKIGMNACMTEDPVLCRFKPKWRAFNKKYRAALASEIVEEIDSDILVIKPNSTSKGNGVIIVAKEDLDKTLEYIFSMSKQLKNDPDTSFSWWYDDSGSQFLIEEFIASDPVFVPHLNQLPYDGTMRIAVVLTYSAGEMSFQIIESHWKLPLKSLGEPGTLNEMHKSFSRIPCYALVSDEIQAQVEIELKEVLLGIYKKVLAQDL